MSAWLHMGGVPPRSTLMLARQSIEARRFVVCSLPQWSARTNRQQAGDTPIDWVLRQGGVPAALALLAEGDSTRPCDFRRLSERAHVLGAAAGPRALASAVDACLEAAGVPRHIGVFTDQDTRSSEHGQVGHGVALAILLRRSGPLFMPTREPQLALLVPTVTTLVFPEDFDDDPE